MTKKEEMELLEQDNGLPESLCSGQRYNPKRKNYDICQKRDSCTKYIKYTQTCILDNYHNLKFVKYYYLKSFKNCILHEQVGI